MLKLNCGPVVPPHIKLFKELKRGLELVSLPHFLYDFWRKLFLLLYSINCLNLIVWLLLRCEILGNMYIVIVCKPGCDVLTWPKSNTSFFGRWELNFKSLKNHWYYVKRNISPNGQKSQKKEFYLVRYFTFMILFQKHLRLLSILLMLIHGHYYCVVFISYFYLTIPDL